MSYFNNSKIKKLTSRIGTYRSGYEDFEAIEDKYIIANGLMIDSDCNVLWDEQWNHGYFSSHYLSNPNVIITDRFAMPGPATVSAGIACIDCNTGEYKWKHFYDDYMEERQAFRRRELDINISEGIWILNDKYLAFGKFIVSIEDGSFIVVNEISDSFLDESIPKSVCKKKLLENYCSYRCKVQDVIFDLRSAMVNGIKVEKKDYFFNKCAGVIKLFDSTYIIAVSAKKNKANNIIFKINSTNIEVEELELPFGGYIEGIYDFFEKGYLIWEVTNHNINSLWYIDKSSLI